MDTTRRALPRSPRPEGSSPTPVSRHNINYRQVDPLFGGAQTTSTYDYWWPYPPGGVYATTTTPPVAPLIPTTTNLLAAPQTNIISDVSSVLDLTLDGDSTTTSDSSLSTSSPSDAITSAASIGPSVISLTALPPDTTTSAPNSSPKKLDRTPSTTVVKYVVPACVVAGVILGSLFAWFVYGCLRARRMRLSGGHGEKRRRPRERLEAGTEYRYMPTEEGDEEKALPEAPGDDSVWDDKDYTLDLEIEHDLPEESGARAQRSDSRYSSRSRGAQGSGGQGYALSDAPPSGSFRWPSAPFANAFTKTNKKSISRANSVADTDVMSLLSHGEDFDTPSKNDRLAANVLQSEPKRRAAHAREQSDLRLEDLGIDLGRPAKYRAKRPVNNRLDTVASSYTVALKTDDGPDDGLNRANTRLTRADTRLSRATTVKSAYSDVSRANTVKSTGGFRIVVESPPSVAGFFGQATPATMFTATPGTMFTATPASIYSALPTPTKIMSSLFGSQEGEEDDRYTPVPQRSRSRSASPVKQGRAGRVESSTKPRGARSVRGSASGSAGGSGSGNGNQDGGKAVRPSAIARPSQSAIARPSHSAMDVLPQSPPLVGSPFLCFDAPPRPAGFDAPERPAPGGGFGWPGAPQTGGLRSPEVDALSPKPARGRGGRLVPKGGRGRQGSP